MDALALLQVRLGGLPAVRDRGIEPQSRRQAPIAVPGEAGAGGVMVTGLLYNADWIVRAAARSLHRMRYVLGISLALVIVLFVVIYLVV